MNPPEDLSLPTTAFIIVLCIYNIVKLKFYIDVSSLLLSEIEGICSNQGDVVKVMCFFVLSSFGINLKFKKYHFKLILNPFYSTKR